MTVAQRSPETLRRDALANRERILAVARECFASEGVDAPVEEIARRAGVGMGTLYRRFPTKADLIDAVLEDDLERFVAIAERRLLDDDPWNGFAGFLVEALELHAENLALREALATESHGGARLEAVRARLRPIVARLVARAQASGQLRRDFSARDLPLVFLTAGRVIQATSAVAPDLWRRYLGLLLDGLRADGATPLPHRPLTRAQLDRLHARKAG